MDRDQVRARVDLVRGLHPLDTELAVALVSDERVKRDHVHVEPLRALRDELTDPSEAEDPERLLVDLDAAELAPLPPALDERLVGLRDVAAEGEHQRDGVLGGGDDVRLRRVRDDDPALGGGRQVDVAHANPRSPDHAHSRGALDQVAGELRSGADHDRVVVADPLR